MSAWSDLLNTVVYPTLALSVTGLVGIGVAYLNKHLGLQTAIAQTGDARLAVQGAIGTFAGMVVGDIASGKLTLADVRNGVPAHDLMDYTAGKVGDSLTQLGLTPATLSTMLVGKVEGLVAPGIIIAAATPATQPIPAA